MTQVVDNNAVAWGEIIYTNAQGEPVHSDFNTAQDREYLHQLLDEWLDRSNRSGIFYVGNPQQLEGN